MKVSTEAIYQYVYSKTGNSLELPKYLASKRKQRNKLWGRKPRKEIIPERISVHDRSDKANKRLEVGHFEADLTFFKGSQSENILVVTERQPDMVS